MIMAGVMTALVLCLLAVAAVPANAVVHTVGDSDGWASGVDYDAWASDKTFVVGDTLLFKYGYPLHTVTEVSESDYNDCSDTNAIGTYTDQNTKIALTAPGARYFICSTPGHCFGGMKLAVTVSAAGIPTPHPQKTPAPLSSAPPSSSSSVDVAEGPSEEPSAGTPSSSSSSSSSLSSSSSYTAKLPYGAATSGAVMAGGSVERKALLWFVVSLLGFGLMG